MSETQVYRVNKIYDWYKTRSEDQTRTTQEASMPPACPSGTHTNATNHQQNGRQNNKKSANSLKKQKTNISI